MPKPSVRGVSIALAAFFVVGVGCAGRQSAVQSTPGSSQSQNLKAGDAAPQFALIAADGKRVSLSDYHGKPVLLYFSMGPG